MSIQRLEWGPDQDQEIIDRLNDLYLYLIQEEQTQGFACRALAGRVASLLELAAGRRFEVRQILPPPTNPRQERSRDRW